ncbi:putative bifunctional diguanylate cyclase/phosphodiesterase [Pseudonocardia sp. GCM10023141]|uniref:putative bifunctional diguanylate cyclase/phosphodiesterase n=1 Tax=Pseudonocardia sp. GCM10023141 TaxID=3252653 RepID=UPI0036124826
MAPPSSDRDDDRLEQLVELVVALASGDGEARMDPSPAADEIDAVIVGINMMAEELQALNVDLEARVAERTHQLEQAQLQLERLALYDPLTGLANRTLLGDRIDAAMSRAERGEATPAVLVLDLDGFKAINDSFGHAVGDLLLIEVARRLRAVVHPGDTVARLGGDEFALVVDATTEQVLELTRRIRNDLQTPVPVGGQSCWVAVSIGVCFAVRGQDAGALLRDADTAMYAAKSGSRGAVQIYEPAMHEAAVARVRLAEELRAAIAHDQLVVHYQPIVELATGRTAGVEALVRWQHPTRGLLLPAEFIGVAEDTGLVTALDRWVLDAAAAQLSIWRSTLLGTSDFALHVNVSPIELRSPGFADCVLDRLARHGVATTDLLLEATENQMMGEDAQTLQALDTLHTAGVRMGIDDFGTGYSSIGYVRRSFVDIVKIDRSLVTGLDTDPQQHRVASAIIAIVEAFGLDAVAEGIETTAQAELLTALGCRYGQGHLWGKAMAAAAMTAHLTVELAAARPATGAPPRQCSLDRPTPAARAAAPRAYDART